jgi:hypothetical protein
LNDCDELINIAPSGDRILMKFKLLGGALTNELLLGIMPFGSAYSLEKDEKTPDEPTVMLAMFLQSVQAHIDPLASPPELTKEIIN